MIRYLISVIKKLLKEEKYEEALKLLEDSDIDTVFEDAVCSGELFPNEFDEAVESLRSEVWGLYRTAISENKFISPEEFNRISNEVKSMVVILQYFLEVMPDIPEYEDKINGMIYDLGDIRRKIIDHYTIPETVCMKKLDIWSDPAFLPF